MSAEQWAAVKQRLARIVAQAYATDHPEFFPGRSRAEADHHTSGPPPTPREDAGAPPARGGGPGKLELEHDVAPDGHD
jgi:hypothetical protein